MQASPIPITWNDDVLNLEGHLDGNARWFRTDLPPGTAAWGRNMRGQIAVLHATCPCGCGEMLTAPVAPGYGGSAWAWDGNTTVPTLQPSIQRLSGCKWHGHLTHGVFTTC